MKLSVIVPLYNAEQYVRICLESLLAQTIIDGMEIIVVDDRGTDRSVEIVRDIINNHPRGSHIRLLETPQNSGAWAARNIGLDEAEGEYIGFTDADDWVEPDMFERLYNEAERLEADWAYCYGQKEYENGDESEVLEPEVTESCELDERVKKDMFVNGVAYFWTAIYNRTFLKVNHIEFPEGKFSEDSYFWWMVVMYSEQLGVVPYVGYHYRIQPNSVSKRPDPEKAHLKQQMYSNLLSYFRGKGLYRIYQKELDYLYIKKGFLIPLLIEAINKQKPDLRAIRRQRHSDEVSLVGNKYLNRDPRGLFLTLAFRIAPRLTARLLKMKYKTDPF